MQQGHGRARRSERLNCSLILQRPEPQHGVVAAGKQRAAVGRECNTQHRSVMRCCYSKQLSGGRVPEPESLVKTPCSKAATVGRKYYTFHLVSACPECADDFS